MRDGNTGVIVGAIVLIVLLFGVFGGGMMGWGMMGPGHMWGWDGDGWGSWWGIGMMLVWLLILVAVVLGVIWFIRQGASRGSGVETTHDRALDTLRERYARGEISHEEFEEKRRDLQSGSGGV
jgi:putative membrane protein